MKKIKEESPLKAAKKKAREAIEMRLNKLLKAITTELGQKAVNLEKESKKLAKKIMKSVKAANKETYKVAPPVAITEKPEKQVTKAIKAQPVSSSKTLSVKKTVVKPAPIKTAAQKPEAVNTAGKKKGQKYQ